MEKIIDKTRLANWVKKAKLQDIFPKDCLEELQLIRYETGEIIYSQGEDLEEIAYFLSGKLKIVHSLENGIDTILNLHEEPGLLGEMELLLDEASSSSVIALEPTLLVQLPKNRFREKLLTDPLFLRYVSLTLAQRLRIFNDQAPTNLHYSVQERLATRFFEQAPDGEAIRLPLKQLAEHYGITYRHLLRVLRQMIDEDLIEKVNRLYRIKNKEKIRNLAIH